MRIQYTSETNVGNEKRVHVVFGPKRRRFVCSRQIDFKNGSGFQPKVFRSIRTNAKYDTVTEMCDRRASKTKGTKNPGGEN